MQPNRRASSYFYTYSVFFDSVVTGASSTKQVSIQADSNFLVQQLIFVSFNVATRVAHPLLTVQITDTSSGMTLFDQALPISAVAGTAELPWLLPTPRIFPASSTISATITNSNGNTLSTYLLFAGQKVSRLG